MGRCGYEEASGHSLGEFHDQTHDEGHVLSLFSQEHIEKVLVGLRDDFGKELCLVSRKGLRVQSGHWSGLVADSSQVCDVQIIASRLDINGVL